MNICQEERHRPTGGDLPGFVEVALRALRADTLDGEKTKPSSSEKGLGEFVLQAGAANTVHRLGQVRCGRVKGRSGAGGNQRLEERGPAQGQMV